MSDVQSSREEVLEEAALQAARAWIQRSVAELTKEGRPIEGGWPGTLNEARALCAQLAAHTLARRSMSALAFDELGRMTRIAYVEARRLWRMA